MKGMDRAARQEVSTSVLVYVVFIAATNTDILTDKHKDCIFSANKLGAVVPFTSPSSGNSNRRIRAIH